MNVIIDKEVDLSHVDLLNTKVYADTLKQLILKAPVNEPLTIGLFGAWGSGKSSIIKTLSIEFSPKNSGITNEDVAEDVTNKIIDPKIAFVIYDAWKYTNDSFRRTFILTLRDKLKVKESPEMKNFYQSSSSETDVKFKMNNPFLMLVCIILLLALWSYYYKPQVFGTWTIAAFVAFLSYTTSIFSKTFLELKRAVQTPIMSAPELFEKCFNDIIDAGLSTSKQSCWSELWNGKQSGRPLYEKIVIVIDNIDRCSKESAYELLTNIKNFINSKYQVVFLLPMDEEALKKHLFKADPTSVDQGEEFLRKFFNVVVRMKAFRNTEMFDFSNKINDQKEIGLKRDTVNIISREYAKNPRRIIQFYNNLSAELKMMSMKHGQKFTKTFEAAICKFLIIREEWPDQFKKICANPKAFLELDPGNLFLVNDGDEGKIVPPESYESFLDSTYVSTRNLKIEDLQKILLNSDNYADFPESVAAACAKGEIRGIKVALDKEGLSKEKVLDHLLFSLKSAIDRELYDTDVSDLMDQLMGFLLSQPGTDKTYIERLESTTARKLKKIIPSTKSFQRLAKFNQLAMIKKKLNFLDKEIKAYFHDFNVVEGKDYQNADFELYYQYLLVADDLQSRNAVGFFIRFLKERKWDERILSGLRSAQFDILYDRDVLSQMFFDSDGPVWLDQNYDHWIELLKKLQDTIVFINLLLDNAGRSLEKYPDGVELFMQKYTGLFKEIPSSFRGAESLAKLHQINDEIFKYDGKSKSSFLTKASSEIRPVIFEYLLECFRFTKGSKSSAGWIMEFVRIATLPPYAKQLSVYVKKYKEEIDFTHLKELTAVVQYIDEDIHSLQLEMLYLTDDTKQLFSDSEIFAVINELSTNLDNYQEYESHLKDHLKNTRARNLLKTKMREMDQQTFNALPNTIKRIVQGRKPV